jgi:hypothetical protein
VSKNFYKDVFIWTEAYNCGEILNPMLASFVSHNDYEINVFGTREDLECIKVKSDLIKYHDLESNKKTKSVEKNILNGYKFAHKGTAELWAHILHSRKERYFLHLDSDTVFLADVVSELVESVRQKNYKLVGSRRPYFNRPYRKEGADGRRLDKLPDVVNTDCFIFDKEYVSLWPRWYLKRKILGRRPVMHPVVDFFDPVSFEIISKGGSVLYIDSLNQNSKGISNPESDFCRKRISFAAVGSGLNFYKNPDVVTSPGYKSFALASYSLYAKWLLGKDIGIIPLNAPEIVSKLEKLNVDTWRLE